MAKLPPSPMNGCQALVQMTLLDGRGQPWTLTISKGMEHFIGRYPRLPGFQTESSLISYTLAASPAD